MFGIIVATSIIGSEDAVAKRGHHKGKWCNPHGCKCDRGCIQKEDIITVLKDFLDVRIRIS